MATFEDIIQEVMLNLEGFTGDQELYGTLETGINATASTLEVLGATYADGSGFTPGLIEVGEEIVYTQEFNRTTGVFTGCLRGWRGSTAVAHLAGTLIRNNPKFPRIAIKRAINDTIKNLHPRVPAVRSYEFRYIAAQNRYLLPSDARAVIAVMYDEPGPSRSWLPVKTWNFEYIAANDNISTTGVYETAPAVNVYQGFPGRNIQVIYYAEPSELTSLSQELNTTGLPDWIRDLIVFGACWRLTAMIDAAKVTNTTVEQAQMVSNANYGAEALRSGQNISKYFFALYNARMQEAEERMQKMYPATVHYKR
jgi:hypothetical protein